MGAFAGGGGARRGLCGIFWTGLSIEIGMVTSGCVSLQAVLYFIPGSVYQEVSTIHRLLSRSFPGR